MFSELPQLADVVRSAFDHLENSLVLRITAFWVIATTTLRSGCSVAPFPQGWSGNDVSRRLLELSHAIGPAVVHAR